MRHMWGYSVNTQSRSDWEASLIFSRKFVNPFVGEGEGMWKIGKILYVWSKQEVFMKTGP